MGIRITVIVGVLVAASVISLPAQQRAAFNLSKGETRQGFFVRMKNDTIHLETAGSDSVRVERAFHKSYFKRIKFDKGDTVNLSASNVNAFTDG
ncbi:MAG: hypothetical protein PHC61_03630 [Chitinivibrionales bacterium]|nr:hypothetical protein [Chitinivibrionales bacterium]